MMISLKQSIAYLTCVSEEALDSARTIVLWLI